MSLKSQLENLATPTASAYSIDNVRRKSLVYENPQSVDSHKCFRDCLSAFNKLCEVDSAFQKFVDTLFSPKSLDLQMCSLFQIHKNRIDSEVAHFLYALNPYISSFNALHALEWLVFKFEIHRYYVDEYMMLFLPHYETALFVKAVQLLDFDKPSNWMWLKPIALRGTPLSRQEFLRACRSQLDLMPFIANSMNVYAKYECDLRLNRLQHFGSFFCSTLSELCDANLPEEKMVKIVNCMQGTIRKGLKNANVPSFQSAIFLAVIRLSLSLKLNHDLVIDWITIILQNTRSKAEWETLRMVNALMRTQDIPILPDRLSDIYEVLLNKLTPVERQMLEKEESINFESVDLSQVASESLKTSERVKKSTITFDVYSKPQQVETSIPGLSSVDCAPKSRLSVKQIRKMKYDYLFQSDPTTIQAFEHVHKQLGSFDYHTFVDMICTILSRTREELLCWNENHADILDTLMLYQCKLAIRALNCAFDAAKRSVDGKLSEMLDEVFPCVLATLLHPLGEIRVEAFDLIQRFKKESESFSCHRMKSNVLRFFGDIDNGPDTYDCVRNLLEGDSLSSLGSISTVFVRSAFRLFCRQPLVDTMLSKISWRAAAELMRSDFLKSLVEVTTSESDGWRALLTLIRLPEYPRFEMVNGVFLEKFDACTLPTLSSIPVSQNAFECRFGVSMLEAELLSALLDLAGDRSAQFGVIITSVFSKLLMKARHYVYCLSELVIMSTRKSVLHSTSRKSDANADVVTLKERKRLCALKVILVSLLADMPRLQAEAVALLSEKLEDGSCKIDRFKCTPKRRVSASSRRASKAREDGDDERSDAKDMDILFSLQSHLNTCILVEKNFQREEAIESRMCGRQRTASTSSSIYLSSDSSNEGDDGYHESETNVLNLSDDNEIISSKQSSYPSINYDNATTSAVNLRRENLDCVLELFGVLTKLFATGNKLAKDGMSRACQNSPLMPRVSVSNVMETIFQSLDVFRESAAIQRQIMICLIEMASMFPVYLCKYLVQLVKWAGGASSEYHSMFLQLDDTHNLSLLGRLVSEAVPALVSVARKRVESALLVLDVFVHGLPDLPPKVPRRSLALYLGLVRGLAQVVAPTPSVDSKTLNSSLAGPTRRASRQAALQGWLWTTAAFFLKTDWPTQEIADLVGPLLVNLYNQFDLSTQLSSWQRCLEFFLYCLSKSSASPTEGAPLPRAKRARLEGGNGENSKQPPLMFTHEYSYVMKALSSTNSIEEECVPKVGRKRPLVNSEVPFDRIRFWTLLSGLAGLFSGLLDSPGHHIRQKEAIERDSLSAVQETFGSVVSLTVQLLIACSSTSNAPEANASREEAVQVLQSTLVKMNSLMTNQVFLDSMVKLMNFENSSLTRKALELLLAKLENLTRKCTPATTLLLHAEEKTVPGQKIEACLEQGLTDIFDQLSTALLRSSALFTAHKSQSKLNHLLLSCLKKLAQLLCSLNPRTVLKTLDAMMSSPASFWWPSTSDTQIKATRVATDAAEVRSLACLFAFECMARLPVAFTSLRSADSVCSARVRRVLRFALDHAAAACHLPTARLLGPAANFHSGEQHLQAGVTLLLGAFEYSTRGTRGIHQPDSILRVLRENDLSSPSKQEDNNEALDASLLSFLFRTTHLDLLAATQAKVDGSAASLKQCEVIIRRLRDRFISLSESSNLLKLTLELIEDASPEREFHLLSGGFEFLSRHVDHVLTLAGASNVDLDTSLPGEGLSNSLVVAYGTEPMLVWRLLVLALSCRPESVDNVSPLKRAACLAGSALLAAMDGDSRLQLVAKCLQWLTECDLGVVAVMARLESFFVVLDKLATRVSPRCFVALVKDANLISLFVCCLSLLSGDHNSKDIKKLVAPLNLSQLLTCFSKNPACVSPVETGACIRATLAAIAAWLRAESQLSACLDTAGNDCVMLLPQILTQPLTAPGLTLNEVDFVPCVAAFLAAIGGDEALLRPFGSSLCALITRSPKWRTRLASLRLLKQTFDTLMETGEGTVSGGDLGLAACLVPDTLVALSEALEDSRPEVEAAANRLFADLEAAGATANE